MFEIEHVIQVENEIGESPRWDIEEQALYWLEIWSSPSLFRLQPKTGAFSQWTPGIHVTGQARRRGGGGAGGFVFATRTGLYLWDERTGAAEFIHDPEANNRPVRFNDGSADRQGRFWAGTTHGDDQSRPEGSLYRLDEDCTVHTMAGGLACSNGLGWSPDNKTMYVTAQFAYELLAFDFDAATGQIENRRVFATVPREDGLPDGVTVDAEGGVWSAHWGGWRLTRYDPDGKIERVVKLPIPNPTSCCFGGPDLKDLYVTTAWGWLTAEERAAAPGCGDLWVVHTDIQGLPEPSFAG
jgi:sugar lactone lactonase YvrE